MIHTTEIKIHNNNNINRGIICYLNNQSFYTQKKTQEHSPRVENIIRTKYCKMSSLRLYGRSILQHFRYPIISEKPLLLLQQSLSLDLLLGLGLDDLDGGVGYALLSKEVLSAGAVHAAGVLKDRLLDIHKELGQVHGVQAHCHAAIVAAAITRVLASVFYDRVFSPKSTD